VLGMQDAAILPSAEPNAIARALIDLVSRIPVSEESRSRDPQTRARAVARLAAFKAAGISGAMALPPGPLGMATVIPDLLAIWHLQQRMVADIAAIFGKSAFLRKETMVYCLFRHGGAALVRDLVARVGERYLIRRTAIQTVQRILQKVGVRITERAIAKGLSRWVPVLGAVGVGAYAYADTKRVAATAVAFFSTDLIVHEE